MAVVLCDPETRKDLAEMDREPAEPAPAVQQAENDMFRNDKRLALIALARAFGVADVGWNRVADAERQYRADVRGGELGQRVTMLQQRLASTREQLAKAKGEQEQAEADHFESLGKSDEGRVESCRAEVLAHNGRVAIIAGEVETIERLVTEAKSELNTTFRNGLPGMWTQLELQASADHFEALDKLLDVVSQPTFIDQLSELYVSARVSDRMGSEGYMYRKDVAKAGIV